MFSGIDFSNRNDVEMGKDEKDELVEINIFSDLTNDDKLVFNVEIVEKKEDLKRRRIDLYQLVSYYQDH